MKQRSSQIEQVEIAQLYQDTSDELRRLLVRKLGNKEEAEEIAHDAYLKLCRIEHRDDIRDLRRYLFTASVHLALNVLRKRHHERSYLAAEQIHRELQQDSDHRSAYRVLLAELKMGAVKAALEELPEKTRQIFLLHRFEGLTYKQIARRVGVSAKTVEYHMKRGMDNVLAATADFNVMDS